jgi:hypothetical protein
MKTGNASLVGNGAAPSAAAKIPLTAEQQAKCERMVRAFAEHFAGARPVAPLDRASRRRLERQMTKDEARGRGSADDSKFFKANPERNFRIRLATQSEILETELTSSAPPRRLPGYARFTLVKQLTPGLRTRLQIDAPLPHGPIEEAPEDAARAAFEHFFKLYRQDGR